MKTREEKLAAIDASMKRWLTRNKRATNQLSRLARQRDRLLKQRDPMRVGKMSPAMAKALEIVDSKETPLPELDAFFQPEPKDSLDLPGFLARGQAAQAAADKAIAEATRPRGHARLAHLAEDMGQALRESSEDARMKDLLDPAGVINRKRLERNDAKRRGPAKIDKTAMPLSGRDAMKAIKAARKPA